MSPVDGDHIQAIDLGIREDEYKVQLSQRRAAAPITHTAAHQPSLEMVQTMVWPNKSPSSVTRGPSPQEEGHKDLDVPSLHNAGTPETEAVGNQPKQRET